jgi:signal transduction histidine kinase
VETDLSEVPVIAGIESELREVMTNLIFNAVDAIAEDGTITISTRFEAGGQDTKTEVSSQSENVRFNANAIMSSLKDRLFSSFSLEEQRDRSGGKVVEASTTSRDDSSY